jgi:16S rRNA (uracil1498-N3)-methyltransferase
VRIPRIYTSQALHPVSTLELEAGPSHHLIKVLRMDAGRQLILFNGDGGEYPSVVSATSKKAAFIAVGERIEKRNQSPLDITLAIAISKGDRMDWVLQKATELGVTSIQPLFSERTEIKLVGDRLEKKINTWNQIVIGACEQCRRNILPTVFAPRAMAEFISDCDAALKLVLHHRTERSLAEISQPSSVCLLVGPEGGLSEQEIILAESRNFSALSLGPRVMRTETAPLAAISILQHRWGDM